MKKKKKQKVKNVHSLVIGFFLIFSFFFLVGNEVEKEVIFLVFANEGKLEEESEETFVDETKPVLNAAIQDGILNIQAEDKDSGVKSIYVNGYEFTDFDNGALSIRLQRFDAGYEYFTIQAVDYAGNQSNRYKLENPYYSKEKEDDEKSMAEQLPTDAIPSNPSDAVAYVTEHIKLRSISDKSMEIQEDKESIENSKEFYTIRTKTDKVFYLIIDRVGNKETVYFLTEISENDLLNVTSDNREVLPQNSVALESAIPIVDSELSSEEKELENKEKETENMKNSNGAKETGVIKGTQKKTYLMIGVLSVIGIGVGYYFKVVKKKKEKFMEEDEEEEEIVYEKEEEEVEVNEDDFFDQQDEEENEA